MPKRAAHLVFLIFAALRRVSCWNPVHASSRTHHTAVSTWQRAHARLEVDFELAKCDAAALCIYSLGKATLETVANGHFDPSPSISSQDLIEISHAFNDAASSAAGWLAAGALLSHTGIFRRPLERDIAVSARQVAVVFSLGGPLALALESAVLSLGAPGAEILVSELRGDLLDLPPRLAVLLAWRVFLAPAMMF